MLAKYYKSDVKRNKTIEQSNHLPFEHEKSMNLNQTLFKTNGILKTQGESDVDKALKTIDNEHL